MQETILPDQPSSPRKRRSPKRIKVACSKCEKTEHIDKVPEGWMTTWNVKQGRFVHQCPTCQIRRRSK